MSAVFIENYRGYNIMFSISNEKFQSDIEDGKEKNSLSSARKEIDDFIKSNQNFSPFLAFCPSLLVINSYKFNVERAFKVVKAIRKDKAFQCEDNTQISDYDMKNKYDGDKWFICNAEYKELVLSELSVLGKERDALNDKIKEIGEKTLELAEKLKGESLFDFRNRKLGETL